MADVAVDNVLAVLAGDPPTCIGCRGGAGKAPAVEVWRGQGPGGGRGLGRLLALWACCNAGVKGALRRPAAALDTGSAAGLVGGRSSVVGEPKNGRYAGISFDPGRRTGVRWWGVRGAGERHRDARHPPRRRRPHRRDRPTRPARRPHQRHRDRLRHRRPVGVRRGDLHDRLAGRPGRHGPRPGRWHRRPGPQTRPAVAHPAGVAGRRVVQRGRSTPSPPTSTPTPSSCSPTTRPP
jgi:hypothetical protein